MNTEQFDGHTPGPWWIDEVSDNGHKDTWLMGNFPQDDMLLCMEFAESNEADVRLIAAAPDLLAEVKRLRQAFLIATGHVGYGNHLGHNELRRALNSAGIDADSLSWAHGEWGEEE